MPPYYCKRILLDNIPLKRYLAYLDELRGKRILLDNIPLKRNDLILSFILVRESY